MTSPNLKVSTVLLQEWNRTRSCRDVAEDTIQMLGGLKLRIQTEFLFCNFQSFHDHVSSFLRVVYLIPSGDKVCQRSADHLEVLCTAHLSVTHALLQRWLYAPLSILSAGLTHVDSESGELALN